MSLKSLRVTRTFFLAFCQPTINGCPKKGVQLLLQLGFPANIPHLQSNLKVEFSIQNCYLHQSYLNAIAIVCHMLLHQRSRQGIINQSFAISS